MSKNKRIEEDITSRKEPKVLYTFIDVDYNGIRGPREDHRYEGTCDEYGEEDADNDFMEEESACCRSTEKQLTKILKSLSEVSIEACMGEKGHMSATIRVETSKRECALSILRGHHLVKVTSVQAGASSGMS